MSIKKLRVVVVGLGLQGSGIARLVVEHGHELAGAVDVGEKVGRPISDFVSGKSVDIAVSGSISELLADIERPDIAVLAANIPGSDIAEQAIECVSQGINTVTLHQDLFGPNEWTQAINEAAIAGGASFLATGVQDTWWVHVPAIAASSSTSITTIRVVSSPPLESLSVGLSETIGIGQNAEDFDKTAQMMLQAPSVLGAPLIETARLMGCTPGPLTKTWGSHTSDKPYEWITAGRTIPVGHAVGTIEQVSFETDRGITFEGVFQIVPAPADIAVEELYILGEPNLHLEYNPFPGEPITNAALFSRIPDVVAAEPGVLSAAQLPPSKYQHRI